MAKRKQANIITAEPAATQAGADGADDLEILNPDRSTTIAGRKITAREYGFIEGLELAPIYAPFVDDLYAMCSKEGQLPPLPVILTMLGQHRDAIIQLISASADVEVEWIRCLDDAPGMNLLYTWWIACGNFFIRRVQDRIASDRALAAAKAKADAVRAGATSTPS